MHSPRRVRSLPESGEAEDSVFGEKLVAIGRKMGRVYVVTGTGVHRARRIYICGQPARCYVDKPWRRV
jgi:hypothetical protein